jgi:hypothetical protein
MKEKILSLTIKDFEVETFCCGGHGGQNVNKRETGVRIKHAPSGAITESREEREQFQNKKIAFKRMSKHPKFLLWCKALVCNHKTDDEIKKEIEESCKEENLKIEYGKSFEE